MTIKSLKKKIKPSTGTNFFPQSQDYLDDLKKAGKYNEYTADKPRINRFKLFIKGDIAFSDITPGLLNKYDAFLRTVITEKKKKLSGRTIANHLAVIRCVFAHARRNKIITKEISPFGGDDGIKIDFPESKKTGPLEDTISTLEELTMVDSRHEHARKLWLFAFYFAGMRVSDVFRLRWDDFINYRLVYSMGKNNKVDSVKIPAKAEKILKHYEQFKENNNGLVFPELKDADFTNEFVVERTIAFKTSALDKVLTKHVAPAAGIEGGLTMHMARHSFGELAGDTIPIQMLQKLYRHSHMSTTIGYQSNFIHQETDDALDAVLNKVMRKPN